MYFYLISMYLFGLSDDIIYYKVNNAIYGKAEKQKYIVVYFKLVLACKMALPVN